MKFKSDQTVEYAKEYGGTYDERGYAVRALSGGGYIVAGHTASYGSGGSDFWVLNLNSDLTVNWEFPYGGTGSEIAYDEIEL